MNRARQYLRYKSVKTGVQVRTEIMRTFKKKGAAPGINEILLQFFADRGGWV
jgi:hypothetical protein